MEEILELKQNLLSGNINRALHIVEELEDVGRKAIIENLESFLVILLIHLIKHQVEQRLTSSCQKSILNSLVAIQKKISWVKKLITYIKRSGENILKIIIRVLC